jgi:fimbrial chaperone protein
MQAHSISVSSSCRRWVAAGKALAFLLATAAASGSWAGSFQVNPIRVDLSAAHRSVALSVTNTGTDAVVVQASVMNWAQEQGRDVLTPTNDVIISPPIATIPAGKEQIVRIGLRRAPDARRELSYRLFLQEVPPPPQPGFQGLQVALRIGLPVFVQPKNGPARAALSWQARLTDENTIHLIVHNEGSGHIQISDVTLSLPDGKEPVATQGGLTYVLPGQSHSWDLKLRQPGFPKNTPLLLKVSTDAGTVSSEVEVASP